MTSETSEVAWTWVVVPYGSKGTQVAAVVGRCMRTGKIKVYKWLKNSRRFVKTAVWIQGQTAKPISYDHPRLREPKYAWVSVEGRS